MDEMYNLNLLADQAATHNDITVMATALNNSEEGLGWITTMERMFILRLAKLFFIVMKMLKITNRLALSKEYIRISTNGGEKALMCVFYLIIAEVTWKEMFFTSIRIRNTTFYFARLTHQQIVSFLIDIKYISFYVTPAVIKLRAKVRDFSPPLVLLRMYSSFNTRLFVVFNFFKTMKNSFANRKMDVLSIVAIHPKPSSLVFNTAAIVVISLWAGA